MKSLIRNRNWCLRRMMFEHCLIIVSLLALNALHVSDAAAMHNKEIKRNETETKSNNICLSSECVHTASWVLRQMKTDVVPCDNFYQFSCGNFIDEVVISEDDGYEDQVSIIKDNLQHQLKGILEEQRNKTDPKYFKLPNALYRACMNESLIEKMGARPIKEISDSLGGWPVIVGTSWDGKNSWSWQETIKKFRSLGFSTDYVIEFLISPNLKNSTKYIIEVDQSVTGLNREYLVKGFNDTFVSAYYDFMVDIAVLLGAEMESAKRELKESLQFEMDLAKISWSIEKKRNYTDMYNLRSIKQLQESYPYVQWLHYINALLPADVQVDEYEMVNVIVPSFFDNLGELLQRTDKRVIANYMMWRMHKSSVNFLTTEFRDKEMKFNSVLYGAEEQEDRWKTCVDMVSDVLGISVGSLYLRKYFKQDFKTDAVEIVSNINEVFKKVLDEIKWMDDKTKEKAKVKLSSMSYTIGYADEILDTDKLEEYYRKLEIDPDRWFKSLLNENVFSTNYSYSKLRWPESKLDWIKYGSPATLEAGYSVIDNKMLLPAAIWQGHLFNAQRPKYMNYGSIGYIIGHEFTHGFDDRGRQFDGKGNLVDWWQTDTEKAYLEKTACIIEQYGNYTDKQTGLKLNGINTQGENIADNGGMRQAYLAYNQWAAKNGEELRLPGLNYTAQQMFWISAAQTMCGKYRDEAMKIQIETDFHSPPESRVLGVLRNLKEFSRDFQCPEGSAMNPRQKCEVW